MSKAVAVKQLPLIFDQTTVFFDKSLGHLKIFADICRAFRGYRATQRCDPRA